MLKIKFQPFPTIKTPRLILRRLKLTDAPEFYFLRSDRTVLRYIDRVPAKSIAHTRTFMKSLFKMEKKGDGINWAITLKGNDKLIGYVCIFKIQKDHYRAELGYILHPTFHGIGIANEAVSAVLKVAFKKFKLHSIEANINPKNKASLKLIKRLGFKKEAHFKENYFSNGKFLDSVIFSKIAPKNS